MQQSEFRLKGRLRVPGDKSISHRALIFSALAQGPCRIQAPSPAEDCRSTAACLAQLGLSISQSGQRQLLVESPGLDGLTAPARDLDAGNSGTTIRLMSGLVAGRPFACRFDGDNSLRARPMARVLDPLKQMGAQIEYLQRADYPPFEITGKALVGSTFSLKVASAQVQTALLIAGLQAAGQTTVFLPGPVRDHTARMFKHINVPFESSANSLTVRALASPLAPFEISVPADISSAAFFMVAAACLPGSQLELPEVGLNSGRTLVIDVLKNMGAQIIVQNEREISGEPVGDLLIRGGDRLKAVTIGGAAIAAGIDEIPILSLAGALCQGTFSVRDAAELRVKESDRLSAIVANLKAAGAEITELADGFDLIGKGHLTGGSPWLTHNDHRLAMTGMVASLLCQEPVSIDDPGCVAISYPDFAADLASLL